MKPFRLRMFAPISGQKMIAAAALLGIWLTTMPVEAQEPEVKPVRPRIGLVLEGGGALGFAHIGVIAWLEAHHIPVDDVAGTSMGGLVGGLYASGLSPKEIQTFVGGVNWSRVLSGQLPFQALSYRRKEDKLAYPNRLEFGLKHGVSFPNGLNSGSAVGLLLDRTMLPYYDLKSFDDLPIPFRCVATEMVSGEKHVFKDGSLAQAMRATMSIPGVFAPVPHAGELYSDGFAVDNLPVDVARDMGAQDVIAVYLNTGKIDPSSLNSLVGVAGRNLSIMVAANEKKSLENASVVVSVDLSKYTSGDFELSKEIIPLGYDAAEKNAAALEKYSVSDVEWNAYVAQRDARRRTKIPEPKFIDVYGVKGVEQQQVEQKFHQFLNKPVDPPKVEDTIADLEGTGLYSSVSYNLIDNAAGEPGLLIRPRAKNYGPPFVNIGLTLDANNANDFLLGLGGRVTFLNVAGPGSELRLNASIGNIAGVNGELYKPLFPGKGLFVAPRLYYEHTVTAIFDENGSQLAQYTENRNGLGVDLGYQFNRKAEIRVGEDYQWYGETRTIGQPISGEFNLEPFVTSLRFQYFGQNDVMVPTKGSIVQTQFSHYTERPNGDGGFSQTNNYLAHFQPVSKRGTVFGLVRGGSSFGALGLGLAGFSLGGPLRLSAYSRGELLGDDYILGTAGFLYRLVRLNPVIGDSVYATGFYEVGKVWNGAFDGPNLPNDIAGGFVVKTLIGPIYGGASIGDSDHRKWFFGLGRVF
jgi:NTE family protein